MGSRLFARARVYVDSHAAAFREAGEILIPINEGVVSEAHVIGELGDVISGQRAGRSTPDEVTVFKSLGLAVEDVIAAKLAVQASTNARTFTL
jgi:ornithine cyclodeaminase/alanine dehydrogenase-like protein (mu-crystallin family)